MTREEASDLKIGDIVRLERFKFKGQLNKWDAPWMLAPDKMGRPGVFTLVDPETGTVIDFDNTSWNTGGACHRCYFERKDVFLSAASHAKRKELGEE